MNHYYVVIDLEFVKVRGQMKQKYGAGTETVQIGAVLLDDAFQKISTFTTFVKPQFGRLDEEIKKLTGITKADLVDAPCICDALDLFAAWLPDNAEITFVAWSDSDQRQMLHEVGYNGYFNDKINASLDNWIDCQKLFGGFMGEPEKMFSLQTALSITNVSDFDMKEHDGLSDAYNTATLFSMLKTNTLKLNEYYKKAHEERTKESFGCTLGDLFAGLNINVA